MYKVYEITEEYEMDLNAQFKLKCDAIRYVDMQNLGTKIRKADFPTFFVENKLDNNIREL